MKSSSFFFEEDISFDENEIWVTTEINLVGRIFYFIIFLFSILFFLFFLAIISGLPFFKNPPYNYIFLIVCISLVLYSVDYFVKNRNLIFFVKIKINKKKCYLEIIDKLDRVRKKRDFGVFKYISLQYVCYGGGKAPFASIVLIGDKSEMSIKKIPFESTKVKAFEAAYQWSLPLSKFLEIPIKNESGN